MKVLFLAPHLSTGGMPAFLLKRIQALQQYTDVEIFVVEWRCYSNTFTVQREQIQKLVGDNFIEYHGNSELQKGIVNLCYEKEIDVIHIEEIPEGFDGFNPFPQEIQKELYDPKHPWVIVETPHGMAFKPKDHKIYHPNGYACVTEQHAVDSYNFDFNHSTLVSFPIDPSIQHPQTQEEVLKNNGWRTKGEYHILNIGLWTPGKNQGYAIELAKELWEKYKFTYIFHFVGNQAPNFKDYWEPLMEDLPPNVIIHGEKSNTSEFFKMADMMLFTSTWECNPIVLKEAISNEVKIMAFYLSHYGNEYKDYINPLSGNSFIDKEKLIDIIHSPLQYSLPQHNNSVKLFAKKYVEFYKMLLTNGTPRKYPN